MKTETLKDIFDQGIIKYSSVIAIRYICDGKVISKTFIDVKKDVNVVEGFINDITKPGAHVGLLCPNSYNWVLGFWSVCVSGRVFVPLNYNLPPEELVQQICFADVHVVLYDATYARIAESLRSLLPECEFYSVEEIGKNANRYSQSFLEDIHNSFCIDRKQLCGIVFTSGTSGAPKAVMLSHENLVDNAEAVDFRLPVGSAFFNVLPMYHMFGITADYLRGFVFGLTICINDKIERLAQNMVLFQPIAMYAVPMIIYSLLKKMESLHRKGIDREIIKNQIFGSNFKYLGCGGAHIDQTVVDAYKEWGILVLLGYGMTECSPCIASSTQWDYRDGSVGKVIKNGEIRIVDGEIWVKSRSVMIGYYKNEADSKKIFEGEWLKTGDLGYLDEDGYLYVTGRKKNLIVLSSGENISPEMIEDELLKFWEIKEVCITEKKDQLIAHIYPDYPGLSTYSQEQITGRIKALIDIYNEEKGYAGRIGSVVISSKEFPKSASGKIIRDKIVEMSF